MKTDLTEIFIDEIYSKKPMKKDPTKKIVSNHFDEIWSIDLEEFSDYKISNKKGFRYIFVIIDIFPIFLRCIPLKNKNSQTITQDYSNIITTSKRSPGKIESDRGAEFYKNIFQNYLKAKNIQHFSRITDTGPSTAERVNITLRELLQKPVFLAGSADWLSELPCITKKYNNTNHHISN